MEQLIEIKYQRKVKIFLDGSNLESEGLGEVMLIRCHDSSGVGFLNIGTMVSGSKPLSAKLSLRVRRFASSLSLPSVGITKCSHIERNCALLDKQKAPQCPSTISRKNSLFFPALIRFVKISSKFVFFYLFKTMHGRTMKNESSYLSLAIFNNVSFVQHAIIPMNDRSR